MTKLSKKLYCVQRDHKIQLAELSFLECQPWKELSKGHKSYLSTQIFDTFSDTDTLGCIRRLTLQQKRDHQERVKTALL